MNGLKAGDKNQPYTADMQVHLATQSSAIDGHSQIFLGKTGACVISAGDERAHDAHRNGTADVPLEFVPAGSSFKKRARRR